MSDQFAASRNFKIISGGQTGADRAGLDWAIEHGLAFGGWCPKGGRSEDGAIPECYGLVETPSTSYIERTEWNVRDSDATIVFTVKDKLDGGSKKTADFAQALGKPWMHFRPGVHPKYIARFLAKHQVLVLNVAGKRESEAPGIEALVKTALSAAISTQF